MRGWFCPIRLIHIIGRKSLHFEKTKISTVLGAAEQKNCSGSLLGILLLAYSLNVPSSKCDEQFLIYLFLGTLNYSETYRSIKQNY